MLAAALVAGVLALFVSLYNQTNPTPPSVAGLGANGSDGPTPGVSASVKAGAKPTAKSNLYEVFPASLTSKIGKNFRGMPGHVVVLTVSSGKVVPRLGFLVPSADRDQFGDMKNAPSQWSETFTARGAYGPYSAIFIQTGAEAVPVSCTVTVDGVRMQSKTITGRFTQGLCYG